MKEVESSGARVILPLVAIVFVLIALWFVVTIREDRVTVPAVVPESIAEVENTPAVEQPLIADQTDRAAVTDSVAEVEDIPAVEQPVVENEPGAASTGDGPYAPDHVFTKITSDQLYQIMKDAGYDVEQDEDNDVRWKLGGKRTLFLTYDQGHALQFYIWLTDTDVSLSDLNDWNRHKRFSRTYLDGDDDPVLELDLDLAGGVTIARILDWVNTCEVSFSKWRRAMGQ